MGHSHRSGRNPADLSAHLRPIPPRGTDPAFQDARITPQVSALRCAEPAEPPGRRCGGVVMGGRNVELAHERWGHLRGDQWRALEWMALKSWDEGRQRNGDPPRRFWAGYRSIAYGLGLIAHEDTPADPEHPDYKLAHS